jgi:hypothetical protein
VGCRRNDSLVRSKLYIFKRCCSNTKKIDLFFNSFTTISFFIHENLTEGRKRRGGCVKGRVREGGALFYFSFKNVK